MSVFTYDFSWYKASALNTPPGDYCRKAETQGNWRGLFPSGGACVLIRESADNLTNLW